MRTLGTGTRQYEAVRWCAGMLGHVRIEEEWAHTAPDSKDGFVVEVGKRKVISTDMRQRKVCSCVHWMCASIVAAADCCAFVAGTNREHVPEKDVRNPAEFKGFCWTKGRIRVLPIFSIEE